MDPPRDLVHHYLDFSEGWDSQVFGFNSGFFPGEPQYTHL